MYSAIKILPIFQPDRSSSSDLRASVSLSPGNSPYGSWNAVNRSGSRRSAASTMSGSSSAFKRSSVRGFGSFLGTSSVEIMRSSSPTPSTTTSFSEVSLCLAFSFVCLHGLTRLPPLRTITARISAVLHSITFPQLDSPIACRTRLFGSSKKTIRRVSEVLPSPTRSWHCSVLRGRRKVLFIENITGRQLESERKKRTGCRCL